MERNLPLSLKRKSFYFKLLSVAIIFVALFSTQNCFAVLKTSAGTGNWNAGATWTPAGVPGNGDDVVIAAGHTVTININTNNILSLTVNGSIIVGNSNVNRFVNSRYY